MSEHSISCAVLTTGRLKLRPFDTARDASRIFEICKSEDVVRFYGMEPMREILEAERLLSCYERGMKAGTSVHWGIVDAATNSLIGDAGLMSIDNRNRRASSYCVLDSAFWGRGLSHDAMKAIFDYAFDKSSLNRVQAYIDVRNSRTIRSVEGIGFVREGVLRGYEIDRGESIDDAVYAITRLDWSRRRNRGFWGNMRLAREKYSWQRYDLDGEEVIWIYDTESRLYHILRENDAEAWLWDEDFALSDEGFPISDRRASNFLSELRKREIPYEIHWDVTNDCNSKCIHCYNIGARSGGRELMGAASKDEECLEMLQTLREVGVFRLVVSGGEPLTRPNIYGLLRNARAYGFQVVIYTNGILVGENEADMLASLRPASVEISVYGSGAKTHDAITRVPGAFEKSTRALRMLKARGVHTVMKCVALHSNYHELKDMAILGAKVADGAIVNYVYYPSLDQSDEPAGQMLRMSDLVELALDPDLRLYFDKPSRQLCRYAPKRLHVCTDCIRSLYINSTGNVYPCIAIPESLGNWRGIFSRRKGGSACERLMYWRNFEFAATNKCGKREYCHYCYSACPGDALLIQGDEHAQPTNHCRIAIARYTAARWVADGRTREDWIVLAADPRAVSDYFHEIGVQEHEYKVGGADDSAERL